MHAVVFGLLATLALQESEGLTLSDVVGNVPRDPASIVVYVMVVVAAVVVWRLGRPRKGM